jgi:methylthioribose-1-phosphate isomerase
MTQQRLSFPFPVAGWTGEIVRLLDQTRLPQELVFRDCRSVNEVCLAIKQLAVRGAPAIGIAAAYALVLSWNVARTESGLSGRDDLLAVFRADLADLASTRPTAVNLFWALQRMSRCVEQATSAGMDATEVQGALQREARAIHEQDVAMSRAMGRCGQELLPRKGSILTHCNAGALATGGYGTALGVVYAAWEAGKHIEVFADETRPLLQGARLTAWEMNNQGIPVTVLPDSAAATLLRQGRVDAVLTGADRIARNGDVANKIGTYPLAVLADRHGVPFYVAAPASTFDPRTACGDDITIEHRGASEVLFCGDVRIAAPEAKAFNPAFDVTPADLVTAFITEKGVLRPPYALSFEGFLDMPRPGC